MPINGQELLYIVLALCILWFTIFLCWLLYQAGRVLRNANTIVESLFHKLELMNEAVHFIRERVDKMSSSMGVETGLVGRLVEQFVDSALNRRFEEKKERKKKNPSSKDPSITI